MPKALHTVIDIWREQEDLPETVADMFMKDISPNVRQTWDSQTDKLFNDVSQAETPAKVWERIIGCLTVKGKEWSFQKSIASYSVRWNTKLLTIQHRLDRLEMDTVNSIPETTFGYLKELSDHLLVALNITKKPRGAR